MVWDPKDPWSKKPDPIDDVLRQAQMQLRQLPLRGIRALVIALAAVILVWQGTFIVAPDEEGVVKRFGDVVRSAGPGPHLKIPFIETVERPKVEKLHRIEVGFRTDRQGRQQMLPKEALMLTGDENILAVEFIVQYKIKNAKDYLFRVDEIEETIGKAAEASMREVVGKSKIDEALTAGKAQIQQDTQTLLQRILDQYQAGVQVAAVQLQDVDPPEAVVAAFKDVASAKEDREKLINQAQGYRNDIIPKAKGEAAQVVNQAKGNAQARVARAEGEAARFVKTLKEYEQAKEIISKRIYIETMESVMAGVEKVIIDGKAAERLLPYLPLDRLHKPATPPATPDEKRPSP
ncbi:MAG: FtsH protease activity modulator HflK [Nitrospirae bacterium]|nr:MAG: HflK protein [Nitrospirae bacterium 13_2_20CM_62_7]OLB55485.1 MAG: HflK protein [Nitrospirae bacterium 13_2_20CM_2_62_8]OLB99581.1 MAG: HflK protein [Nitrospirae bacterium 13_1_40CM_62_7]OLC42383.1 MAG: HflK protein [Nitrospirae bacterium 13_1_40CM_4_62_6]OLC80882.1 MAG: HflK protein [Nitrospirae bacterium 13_1_40CM_3_62_11]OLD42022.1 MAG: HflK protein [Nitrospirae bacterium 13_1_40CM_2_62_10]OLE41687.1 MAG: HflK protein [Nitrospirae bacterium 13_1_20CM_2_62_14]TLY44843.1 MAG: FtsH p